MSSATADRDVVVIGGGVIGCAVARALSPDLDVLLIEKDQIAGEASGLAAGNVNPALSYPDQPTVARYIRTCFERFDGTADVTFTTRPRLELVAEGAGTAARDRATELQTRGLPVEFRTADQIEAQQPIFDLDKYTGAIRFRDGGWIDPYTYTVTLRREAVDRGAEIRTGTRVRSLDSVDGHWTVHTEDGEVVADHLIVAAGWRTADLLKPIVDLPVRPFLTQCVTLEPASPLDGAFPMGREPFANLYFRPELNGDLLVGGGRTTGIDDADVASGGIEAQSEFRRTVAETVPRFLRGFADAAAGDGWAGIDGATPDGHPIIDNPEAGPDGLVVATGFHGGGIRDSPVAAAIVRSIVLDESVPFTESAFEVARFESRSRNFPVSKEYDRSTMVGGGIDSDR